MSLLGGPQSPQLTDNMSHGLFLFLSVSVSVKSGAPGAPMMPMVRPGFPAAGATPGAPVLCSLS